MNTVLDVGRRTIIIFLQTGDERLNSSQGDTTEQGDKHHRIRDE
jgi:hypothetical protein